MTTPQRPEGYREPTNKQMQCLPEGTLVYYGYEWVPSANIGSIANAALSYAVPLTKEEILKLCDEKIAALNQGPGFDWTMPRSEVPPAIESGADPKGEAGATKCPLWLIPPEPMEEAAFVLALGARKYGPWNWRQNKVCASTYVSAIMRHLNAWRDGEDNDAESGKSHLAHVAANCFILMDAMLFGKLVDDRAKKEF